MTGERDHWTVNGELRVHDLSEDALLAKMIPRLPIGRQTRIGPGDDAAMIQVGSGLALVSADILVEDRHFRRQWSSGADVGWRAAMQNFADIAAMGASPSSVLVSLVCPSDLEVAWVEDFADGLALACLTADVGVVGGDLSGGDAITVAITVIGEAILPEPVRRSGAQVGDQVALAGVQGHSAAGLAICVALQDRLDRGGDADLGISGAEDLVLAYLRPAPPLSAGPAAASAGANAMLDVSDGLIRDAARIARASGVTLRLDDPRITFAEDLGVVGAAAQRLQLDPLEWVLRGGEDHGLLATFPSEAVLPENFRRIGAVEHASEDGSETIVTGIEASQSRPGWDHFSRG